MSVSLRPFALRPFLTALLLTVAMPCAEALSSVTLPITVPLAGVQAAANARVPAEFARVDQEQSFLGGLVSVKLAGTVTRTGAVTVKPDGDALLVSVPIRADMHAAPGGVGSVLARDFGGSASVTLRLKPFVTPDWEAGADIKGDYAWTDPLSVELTPGVKVSVQSLVDGQVRTQLDRVAADVARAVREGAQLRQRAGTLWARVQQPWTLPAPQPAYALVKPVNVTVTPFRFTPDALKLTVGTTFNLQAGLGRAPAVTSMPLPTLKIRDILPEGVDLTVPVVLPFVELSRVASAYAAREAVTLPLPTRPTVQVTRVSVKPAGTKLLVAVQVMVRGPLGLKVNATLDVTGTPKLDAGGRVVTLEGVSVRTRREGLTGTVISLLADARAQAYVTRAARFDLTPQLEQARAQAQARLPMTPTPGLQLGGTVGPLKLSGLSVQPSALVVQAAASGQLQVKVDAGAMR
ncbi:DUF4403 family protein [Deinococcus cavernae]|uniref:DUF4403 family protein n=1 Tax=Deinococcus cavernae TaxID=2320857 RepID=A0A418V9I5_9DEIO|nr:DUF4403 family protein [Deinococcus cavernae]RJF72717.1 DUF4403 family protein [Deinococcus cavernae]